MNEREKYEKYAKKIKIFCGLTPEEVAFIVSHGHLLHFQQGQTIFHEGTLGSNLFIVLNGQIMLSNRDKTIGRCQPGDAFGEMAVLNHRPRCATASALSDVTLLTMNENELRDVFEKKVAVHFLLNVIHVLSERLEAANTWIEENRERLRQLKV
jgi:CRP/FNR family transcriptional regulator